MDIEEKKRIVKAFLGKGVLLSPDLVDGIPLPGEGSGEEGKEPFFLPPGALYLHADFLALPHPEGLNWEEGERARAEFEKGKGERYQAFLARAGEKPSPKSVRIITSHEETSTKREPQDFTLYFNARLEALQKILYAREELKNATSVSRVLAKRERETVAVIGLVTDKATTKNGNIMLTLEDSTDVIKVLVSKNKPELMEQAKDIVMDEALGVVGVCGERIIFANSLVWPDIPLTNELKKSPEEGYALFLSDLHVGSTHFLEEDFSRFLSWIRGETGNERQRAMAKKVKYIFILGDIAAGVGIYPGQEKDLLLPDIRQQYQRTTELLRQIPSHIPLIICPGNHDAVRIAEPQPVILTEYSESLRQLPNAVFISNPAIVNIHASPSFPGYNVLIYHGYSFDYYVANVDSIRNSGGYDRADLIMKFLLKRRHLAPAHTSTLYIPYTDQDPLVISQVPDIFATGHIHKTAVSTYRNVTMICGSCWEGMTDFQEKVGHHPEPSRVPIIDLKTREVKILRFGK